MRLLVLTTEHLYMKSKFNIIKKNQRTFKKKIVGILLKVFLISMFFFSFQSCDLKLDEEVVYPAIVLNDSIVGITDEYKFLEVDTLYFTPGQNMSFYPEFKQESVNYSRSIHSVDFILNGNEFKPNSGYNYNFTMPDIPATYDLIAKINCTVKTGNIANITDQERYLFEKKWVLIIYEFENQSPSYVNYSFEDGRLKIEWEKCPLPFIKGYRIYDPIYPNNLTLMAKTDFNYLIDSAYSGYSGYRWIRAVTRGNSEISWGRYDIRGPFPQMTVIASTDPCEKRKVIWNVPKFYNNVTSTQFYINDVLLSTSHNVYDTVRFLGDSPFGSTDKIHVNFNSLGSDKLLTYGHSVVKTTSLSGYEYSSETFSKVFPATDNFFLNLQQDKYLISYLSSGISTGDTLIINNYKETSFAISPDGTKFAFLTNSGEIKYGEVNNLNQLVTSPSLTNFNLLKISDNGIACVKSGNSSIQFYDLNSMVVLESLSLIVNVDNITDISTNASYFGLKTWNARLVYKRDNGSLFKLHEIPSQSQSVNYTLCFNPLSPEQFFYWDSQEFSCRNLNNSEINYSYPLVVDKILHLDFSNNRMLVSVGSNLRIIRVTDGSILNEIPYSTENPLGSSFGNNSILIGNKIVSQSLMYCF